MTEKKNIVIIGAGPVGNYTAYLLAKLGHCVSVYEEHSAIGSPIQCTGLLTKDFDKYFPWTDKKEFLVSTFDNVTLKTKNKSLKVKEKEYLVCRTKFDNYFANLAKSVGVNFFLSHSFKGKKNIEGKEYLIIKNNVSGEDIKIGFDLVVAADGPLSKTAKAFDMFDSSRENYFGIQALVSGNFDPKNYEVYFGSEYCKDFFVWIVPESETLARVGLCSKGNSKAIFDKFMKKHPSWKIKEMQAGVIPIYSHSQILFKNNCFVVGDSAGQVKATTLGGLIPGLRAAEKLAKSVQGNNYKSYSNKCLKIRAELLLHKSIRKAMDNFTDQNWDKLVSLASQKRIIKVLEKYSRDNPIPLLTNLVLLEPRFLTFLPKIF